MTAFGESTLAAARKQVAKLQDDLRQAIHTANGADRAKAVNAALDRARVVASNLDQVAELEREQ